MSFIAKDSVPETEGVSGYPGSYNLGRGKLYYRPVSDTGGLTQFGAAIERLEPGARSSQLHWHSHEDEFLYLLQGRLTVLEGDTETVIEPGDACCWKAGDPVGHSVRNDSDEAAIYIIAGSRVEGDICIYPECDMILTPKGFLHLDGTPWDKG